jgi:large subunit ribosomal protein L7/L12
LKDAKGLVDEAPSTIKEGVDKAEADEYKKQLEDAGAKVELK